MSSDTEEGSKKITHSDLIQNKIQTSAKVDSTTSLNSKTVLSNDSIGKVFQEPIPVGKFSSYDDDSDYSLDEGLDAPATDMDYVEYNFSKIRGNESYTILNRDFGNVESQYNNRLLKQNEELGSDEKETKSPSKLAKQREFDISQDTDDDDDWKEINTQLNCGDIYNLKGEKIESFIHSNESLTEKGADDAALKTKGKGSNVGKRVVSAVTGIKIGKDRKREELNERYHKAHATSLDKDQQGYTRIDVEEQVKKFGEMDKKFDFLFQNENSNLRKLHQQANSSLTDLSKNDLNLTVHEFVAPEKFDDVFLNEGRPDVQLDPNTQMMSTKSMLDDGQKIAYAALVKLIIVQLNTDLALLRGSGSTSILKKLAVSNKSFMRWSMTIMDAIYDHLDINKPEERSMIETLSCHGVETQDLTKVFDKRITIENHLKEEKDELQMINVDCESNDNIEIDVKWTLICDLFLILLEASVYDSRSRTLLMNFAKSIGIDTLEIYQFERRITDSLEIDETMEIMQNQQTWDEKDLLKQHKKKSKKKKIVKIALATAAGGLVIGLSAGALAPVIGAGLAAGLTTIGIGGTSGFLAGSAGTAIITTGGVLSGMRAGGVAMNNRAGSVNTFEFIPLHNNKRVNLILTVSGWMSGEMDDIRLPFSTVDQVMGDLYSLLWEPDMLTSTGQTIGILANEVLTQSIQQILGSTLLITLMSGLQLPMMLSKLGYILDNPWNVSLDRAWAAGGILADTLRRKKLGGRPITLVGFSLGARLIYSCLLSLAKSGDYGIVENVYLFGSPFVIKEDEIALARSCVSGKFVNGYLKQDWILGYLFRATSGGLRTIAGLSPIDNEQFNIENVDCSEHVAGHMQYREAMPKLLKHIGWEVLEDQFVEIEQPNPEEEERQRKLLSDFEKAQHTKKKKGWYNKWFGKSKNTEWWEMYEEGEKEKKEKQMFDIDALQKEVARIEHEAEKKKAKKKKKSKKGSKDQEHDEEQDITLKITGTSYQQDIAGAEQNSNEHEGDATEIDQVENNNTIHVQDLEKTPDLKNIQKSFHCSPDNVKPPSQVNFSPKQLKNRKSMIQLIAPPMSTAIEPLKDENVSLDKRAGHGKNGQLKSFRITSHSEPAKLDHKSPNIGFGLFNFNQGKPKEGLPEKDDIKHTNHGLGFDIVKVTKDPEEMEESKETHLLESPLKSKYAAIDYGDDLIPTTEGDIHIAYGDEFDHLEDKVREKHRDKPGFGATMEINYGDEDEFPLDESKIAVSIS